MRFSIFETFLISPDKLISPIITQSESTTTSRKQVAIASAIPKSAAGSSISIPPMVLTYTSCFDKLSPILFSYIAIIWRSLLYSIPVETLLGEG